MKFFNSDATLNERTALLADRSEYKATQEKKFTQYSWLMFSGMCTIIGVMFCPGAVLAKNQFANRDPTNFRQWPECTPGPNHPSLEKCIHDLLVFTDIVTVGAIAFLGIAGLVFLVQLISKCLEVCHAKVQKDRGLTRLDADVSGIEARL